MDQDEPVDWGGDDAVTDGEDGPCEELSPEDQARIAARAARSAARRASALDTRRDPNYEALEEARLRNYDYHMDRDFANNEFHF
eukprot:10303180-Heterocapsa_arctica.AAC.1